MANKQESALALKGKTTHLMDASVSVATGTPTDFSPLYEDMATILYKATVACPRFYEVCAENPFFGFAVILNESLDAKQHADRLLPQMPEYWQLKNQQVLLLISLFECQDAWHREAFISAARNSFRRTAHAARWSAHLFIVLARVSDFTTAVAAALGGFVPDDIGWGTLRSISEYVKFDNARLSDQDLNRLLKSVSDVSRIVKSPSQIEATTSKLRVNDCTHMLSRITKQVREIKYQRLKGALQRGVNLEVNQDKDSLAAELGRFGFTKELIECLERIETLYRQAEDKFDFKCCVDLNRSFFETLLWQIAQKVAAATGNNKVPEARKESPASVRDYLKRVGYLSERLHKFCEAFYQLASDESAHNLSSGREVARIVRNMNVELGLLLLHRLNLFGAARCGQMLQATTTVPAVR